MLVLAEMNEHLGHAGSGVGRRELHFGHKPRLPIDVVDDGLWWGVARNAARRLNETVS